MKSAILCLWCVCFCISCRPVPTGISRSAITSDPALNAMTADGARSTSVIAVGDWSKPVKDAEGYILRGRLILYDTPHYTNTFQGASPTEYWGNAPLFLELENLSPRTDKSLAVYFALQDGLECDLRDSRGWQVTNSIFGFTSGSLRPWFRSYWITVPLDGSVRLRADPQRGGHSPKAGGLEIELSLGQRWIIPAGDMSAYYLRQFQPAVESSGAAWLPCVAGQTHAATHEDNRPQAMKSRKLILLPVLFTGVAEVFAILLWNSHPAEPVYEGKSLSEWLPAFDYANRDVPGLSPRDASRAVRAAGTNAFPLCLECSAPQIRRSNSNSWHCLKTKNR